jgi:tRNA threonylcarbamoyladenosine modification (KEOPS) complex  Pcc1 subunit
MNIKCEIMLDFKSEKTAKTVFKSIEADNFNFVKCHILEKNLVANIKSKSISSLLHTLDDYLSCASVAGKIADKD